MSESHPLFRWLPEIAGAALTTSDEDLHAEANSNLWQIALGPSDAAAVSPRDILSFIDHVVARWERQIVDRFGHDRRMLFYAWFDEPADQLRFSLVSAAHKGLPFGGRVL